MLRAVRDAGVIGAGGAGFPTHAKLSARVETVIANGAECEPLLRCDRQLMERYPRDIVDGMRIAMDITGARRGFIGLKKKYAEAISALGEVLREEKDRIKLFPLENFYPAGDEQVLVYEVLGRVVPEGGLPLHVGAVVDNVGTLMQISKARSGIPVTERWVTVTGAVREPKTLLLPVGTPVEKVIGMAGGTSDGNCSVISGGPMMGKLLSSLAEPVTKTTSGLIVLPDDHYIVRSKRRPPIVNVRYTIAACIQCQMCTDVCPRGNLGKFVCPDKVMKGVAYGVIGRPEHLTTSFLCVECGLCTHYGCPMGLDPCGMMGKIKSELAAAGMTNPHCREEIGAGEYREYRKVPLKRLVSRLDLFKYDVDAPMEDGIKSVDEVFIPLDQHIGAPAVPVVKVGERVRKGQLIGEIPENALGARYHASIAGTVKEVGNTVIIGSE